MIGHSLKVKAKPPPLGQPVAEESDDDPDFRRGPVPEATKQKGRSKRSGKRRNESEVSKSLPQPPSKKRRVSNKQVVEPICNPLIELLGVDGDSYFQQWNRAGEDEEAEAIEDNDVDEDESMELGISIKTTKKTVPSPTIPLLPDGANLSDATTEADDEDGPVDLSHLDMRKNNFLAMASNILQQESSKAMRRRKRLEEDPDATEEDSDDEDATFQESQDYTQSKPPVSRNGVETYDPKPQFNTVDPPPYIGPHVLHVVDGIQIPGSINQFLRPYQRDGVEFMWDRYHKGSGGILGDDMGLGKTVQVISFLSAIMKKHADRRDIWRRQLHTTTLLDRGYKLPTSLIDIPELPLPKANATWPTCLLVVPAVLISNWKSELDTWGYFEFAVYESKRTREDTLQQFKYGRLDIMIVSSDTVSGSPGLFCDLDWSVVIVDEAHRMKNPKSKIHSAMNTFRCIRRFALTGTAIQNNYEELWSLINWTNPGKVGNLIQWKWSVSAPLKSRLGIYIKDSADLTLEGQSTTATLEERDRAQKVANNLVQKLLPQFFLRRTKKLLEGQMPNKIDQVVFCPLTRKQKRVYRNCLATPEIQRLLIKDNPCDCGKPIKSKHCCHKIGKGDLLHALGLLIKISNSLFLIYPVKDDDPLTYKLNLELQAVAFPEMTHIERMTPTTVSADEECGKWKVLKGLLQDWSDENDELRRQVPQDDPTLASKLNKVLIFTKSKKLLDYIACTLQYEGFDYRELHGKVKRVDRDANVDEFQSNSDLFIFLITTQTGGVGLNLTAANKVIIFDPNWNPAHDLQAMDRAFRIGQLRDVEVYRLVAAGCLEELIYKRQLYKQQQMMIAYEARTQTRYFEGIQGDKEMPGELFGIKNILALSDTNDVEQRVEKARIEEAMWREVVPDVILEEGMKDTRSMVAFLTESPEVTRAKVIKKKKDIMAQKLAEYGAAYTHSNEELLHTSIAETAKLNPTRYRKRESNGKLKSYEIPTRKRKGIEAMELSD